MLMHHLLDEAAQRRPEAPAIRCAGETLTYGELARQAYGLARWLRDAGLRRGDRVAVLLGKSFHVPVSFYAVFAAGGVLVPIDPKSPVEQIVRILRKTGAEHLVTETKIRAVAEVLKQCPELEHVFGIDASPWTDLAEEERAPDVRLIETDPCYVLHTSGSTGTPKLIRHTHHSALSFVHWAAAEYELRPEDRLSNHSSHHTCFATFDYYAAARVGAATVLLTPSVMMMPASLSSLIEKERISVWYSVPTALVQLSLRGELENRDLSAMRWILFAGETFPEKHLRTLMGQLPEARFSHVYGSTEVNVCTYYHLSPTSDLRSPLPIGKACSNDATLIEDGELLVRGSTVMSGYWDDPERNQEALVRRPAGGGFDEIYFRTGDRVQLLEDGNLAFDGRSDFQIKVRGHRVELGEVETALLSLDEVEEAVAFAVPDGESSSAVHAAVVVGGERSARELSAQELSARELSDALRKVLPPYAVPAQLQILDRLPRTPTGKVDRKALVTETLATVENQE